MSERDLLRAWQRDDARVLFVSEGQVLVNHAGLPLWQPTPGEWNEQTVYLGLERGQPRFARFVASENARVPSEEPRTHETEMSESWAHPFSFLSQLDDTARDLVSAALALANWHGTSGHTPRTGESTRAVHGGWARVDAHGTEEFPRTDPAVIVLIEHENRVLLGSNVLWEQGRFSLLAGFVEAGESAEQAVHREVLEEAGVRVERLKYVASQPWPFPRSLMIGFRASLLSGTSPDELYPDPDEISELRWFTRDELKHPAPGTRFPQSLSIAGWMLEQWMQEPDSA